jgi:hypothetical protein
MKARKKKLRNYGGQGFTYSPECGDYRVKFGGDKEIRFIKLSVARKFYDNLHDEKAIWDMNGLPELLDCHTF